MKPFLECNIWSVFHNEYNPSWFYVHKIYYYNSLNTDPNALEGDFVQVPEPIIEDLHLLHSVDPTIVHERMIPLVKKYDSTKWKIDLEIYNETVINL